MGTWEGGKGGFNPCYPGSGAVPDAHVFGPSLKSRGCEKDGLSCIIKSVLTSHLTLQNLNDSHSKTLIPRWAGDDVVRGQPILGVSKVGSPE